MSPMRPLEEPHDPPQDEASTLGDDVDPAGAPTLLERARALWCQLVSGLG